MNSLVLIPSKDGLRYSRVFLESGEPFASLSGLARLRGTAASLPNLELALDANRDQAIDVLTIRAVFGGNDFATPVIVDDDHEKKLLHLRSQSPLSVASTTTLIADAQTMFPKVPIAVAFETSFFVDLPARESTYALPRAAGNSVRRWGYHGLFHAAATQELAGMLKLGPRPARMLSICLDSRPEMAAVQGRVPLAVTSGSTPMEGLPGEANCGEIDPSIALALAADPEIGPERANLMLTRESGFFGMLGWRATLGEVLTEKRARIVRVREHLLYHMALAAGSSLAALEMLDGVVFSGRYAEQSDVVASYLMPRLERALSLPAGSLPWHTCRTPLDIIVAQAGIAALVTKKGGQASQTQ
jgi:acetate kinase